MAGKSWRDVIKIHPAAELFPPLNDTERADLTASIKQRGILQPIVFWQPDKNGERQLLDGIHRLDAAERVGQLDLNNFLWRLQIGGDPYEIAITLNLHRRHLTREQQNELIDKLLAARPEMSDRQIGKAAGKDNKTVAKRRKTKEAREEIPHVERRIDTKGRKQPAVGQKKAKPSAKTNGVHPADAGLGASAPVIDVPIAPTVDAHEQRCAELDAIAESSGRDGISGLSVEERGRPPPHLENQPFPGGTGTYFDEFVRRRGHVQLYTPAEQAMVEIALVPSAYAAYGQARRDRDFDALIAANNKLAKAAIEENAQLLERRDYLDMSKGQ
jgi:hypothetical protein